MDKAKPFRISKRKVWEAWKQVKANKGAAGVDGESIAEFERDLNDNLYKLWNRMSSGSYFPPPVRTVEIPKDGGGKRPLGIPTVADRIVQTVVKSYLEPGVDPCFHPDSYGYRSGKSAIEAVGVARQRCWRYNWVLDLDIRGFFDNLDHELMMRAVRKHTDCKWILLYIERWLKAPAQREDGTVVRRDKGTPQGGVISPLLANLFLHYACDMWMKRYFPTIPFERYADDIICHCKSELQARFLLASIERRLAGCKLEVNPQKTKIVYCKDHNRRGGYPNEGFDFLGFSFRARLSKNRKGTLFENFSPGVSSQATKAIRQTMRSWRLHKCSERSLDELARIINPVIRGWLNYYGSYYKSALFPTFECLERILSKWAARKYKRFKGRRKPARHWLRRVFRRQPMLFAHWQLLYSTAGQ